MFRKLLHSKIHQAVVTEARPDYQGSLTVDASLLEQCGMRANDAILIANCETGARFETYLFRGEPGSGVIGVNGAAAPRRAMASKLLHAAGTMPPATARPTLALPGEQSAMGWAVVGFGMRDVGCGIWDWGIIF